jgi:hypothetical protein
MGNTDVHLPGARSPVIDPRPPRAVFLFSGHMIDAPGRPRPRFPADRELLAGRAIADSLGALQARHGDVGICGGACGGDLLFAEAALALHVALRLHLPLEESEFLEASVDYAGASWRARYLAVKRHPHTQLQVAPEALGPLPAGVDPYERNNIWMLNEAMRVDPARVHFVCLWNGEGGDGPGGTRHMLEEVRRQGGSVHWLDTTKLW